jgi:mRNA interferase MazF
VSLEVLNRVLDTVVVCPLTTKLHPGWRSRLQTRCAGKRAEIAVDQIRTISTLRLVRKVDTVNTTTAEKLRQIIVDMYGTP